MALIEPFNEVALLQAVHALLKGEARAAALTLDQKGHDATPVDR
jgi:hypothetical protein